MSAPAHFQSYAAMLSGYEGARARFAEATSGDDPTKAFTALFEALNWAVALDERTAKSWAPDGQVLHWAWRSRVPDASIMGGVRYARNRIHHQWADALRLDHSWFQFPRTFPLRFAEWVWRDAASLPPGRIDRDGETSYRNDLEGRAARITLQRLANAFAFLRRVLEPSTLMNDDLSEGA